MVNKILNFLRTSKGFFWVIAVYLLVSIVGMIYTPLFDEDEGFFAEASRNMLSTNNFISIQVNGEERYDKPALFFWFTALSLKIFGNNEFAVRFPSFIFFVITLFQFYKFVSKHFSVLQAELSILVAIAILQFQILGRAAVSDNLLTLCITLSLLSFYKFLLEPRNSNIFWVYTYAGLGFFTKGPIAFVIIGGVIFTYLLLSNNIGFIKKLLNPMFIFWSIFISAPWFILAYQKSGDFLFTDFFIKHNLSRFSNTMESHGGSLLFYIPVIFLAFLPFCHLILGTFKKFKFNDRNTYFFLWFIIPFTVFSFSKTQLPHYISVGYLPLIILMTRGENIKVKWVSLQIIVLIFIYLLAPLIINTIKIEDEFVDEMLQNLFLVFDNFYFSIAITFLVLALFFVLYFKENVYPLFIVYFLSTTLFIYKFAILQQGFVKETGLNLKKSKVKIFMMDHYNPSLSFYAETIFEINTNPKPGEFVFRKFKKNQSHLFEVKSSKNGYYILQKK